jgi:hypothetical protein
MIKSAFDSTVTCTNEGAFTRNYDQLISLVSSNTEASNRSYNYPLLALERTKFFSEKCIDQYCSSIIPKLDTDSLTNIEDTIDQYAFEDIVKEKIKKVVKENLIADRILVNHANINERCDNIESVIIAANRLGSFVVAEQVKGYIDTYSIRPYQKMNLCLEEVYFVLGKNNIYYDKSDMVKSIMEAFILSDYKEKKENYNKVLENNYCYTDDEVKDAVDALAAEDGITGTIHSVIDEYIRVGTIPLMDLCINIGGCSISDIKLNLDAALDFIWRCIESKQISYEEMQSAISAMFETMANKIAISNDLMTIEEVKKIVNNVDAYIVCSRDKGNSAIYTDSKERLDSFLNCLALCKDQFFKDCSYLYNKNNIDTIARLNTESATIVTLQEYKKFRFSNLIKSAINLEKYIKAKAKSVFAKPKKTKIKPFKFKKTPGESLIFEDYELESFIGSDNKADICVAQYYYNEACEYECKDFFNTVCDEFNKTMKDKNIQAYYIFNTGICEVHLKENVYINLTEEEKETVDKAVDPAEFVYLYTIGKSEKVIDKLANLDSIFDRIVEDKEVITNEQFELLIEALQYLNVSKADIEPLAEKYTEYRYKTLLSEGAVEAYQEEVDEIDRILESFEQLDELVPIDVQLEAAELVCSILEVGIKKPDIKKASIKKADASGGKKSSHHDYDEDDDEDYDEDEDDSDDDEDEDKEESPEEKAEDKKKIDDMFDPRAEHKSGFGKAINGLRLAMKGLMAKTGDMGNKHQELCKNLDASVSHLIKAMHDALISDRREAIIKGSVIPSFSKCIHTALGLAGAGIASMVVIGNIMPVVIGAIGAFALSKKLTNQERMLLLDDIETELDVVDKEIQNAESKNQMKKYRALLKYKKDLQRQYQRIRYNRRIGKDILPNSATGVYKSGD